MITCTRRIQFCAGHRVMGHENKCAHLHGHNYVAFFEAEGDLDNIGRVIDFSVLKERIGGWIDEYWDHGFILFGDDYALSRLLNQFTAPLLKMYLLPANPTAENMAEYLLDEVCPAVLKDTGVKVTKVTLWETENCKATATLG